MEVQKGVSLTDFYYDNQSMSPVSTVFHTVVTVNIHLEVVQDW